MAKRSRNVSRNSWWEFRKDKWPEEYLSQFIPRHDDFGEDFVEDIKEEIDILQQGKRVQDSLLLSSFYFTYLTDFYELFNESQLCILKSESFFENPASVLREIEEFIGGKEL